ncbi:MAG: dUTP diphosphatase [Pseudomonadales bacterium]|nr:dUTP diphosphatase [Pseudomonadales bacterium]
MAADTQQTRRSHMLLTMAQMQEAHNRLVHPDWRTQGYEYYRAIWVECAELLDHFGWKWWKQQHADTDQVKLEIVDIWHFGLSDLIRAGSLDADMLDPVSFDPVADPGGRRFRDSVETLAQITLMKRAFDLKTFVKVMQSLPMGFEELFHMYVGKNVLNTFRQDNGYKSGTYRKLWEDREDNEHLVEVLGVLECDPEDIPTRLYQALEQRYRASEPR